MLLFFLLLPQSTPGKKKQQIEKTKTCFPRYLFSLFSVSHSFTFLLFLYLLWLFVVVVVVGCWLLLVVVVCCCCCCCCCFVVLLFVLLRAHQPKKTQQKKQQNPLFYSVFCALVFRGLWPEKGQQTKDQRIIKIFFHFSRKRFFLQNGAFGFRVVVIFLRRFSFFSWLAFVAKF